MPEKQCEPRLAEGDALLVFAIGYLNGVPNIKRRQGPFSTSYNFLSRADTYLHRRYGDSDQLDARAAAALSPSDPSGSQDSLSQCESCGALWVSSALKPIADIFQRVAPGEPMPAGECPTCGALCHLLK